jgi:uncharacterized protein involved in type VI secretion and phage assembly
MVQPSDSTAAETRQDDRFFGKYRGIVTDNEDPKDLGRVKARVPEVLGDVETGWALPCLPYTGDGSGQYTIPDPETGVWIEFEGGDLSRPIWTGCWWGDGQVPEDNDGNSGSPATKVIRTENGLMVTMDDDSQTIHVSDENGRNLLEIEVSKGTIRIEGTSKAVVEAPQIELVENASHPVVFGDNLMQYLSQAVQQYQAHTHPGQTVLGIPVTPAPPVPPLPAPTPSLVSKKVKSG